MQRWPETKRLLGLFVNSSGRAHGRNARRIVHAARQQDRRLAVALLAAAVAHTPEAEEVLRGARMRMARKPSAVARELLRNFPKQASAGGGARAETASRRTARLPSARRLEAEAPETDADAGRAVELALEHAWTNRPMSWTSGLLGEPQADLARAERHRLAVVALDDQVPVAVDLAGYARTVLPLDPRPASASRA